MKNRYTRQEEAEDRQKVYNALSTKQKLELIASRRGKSKKERAKLEGQQHGNTSSKAVSEGKRVKKG